MEGTATAFCLDSTYGSAATLQYNTATARNAGVEWPTTFFWNRRSNYKKTQELLP